MIPQGYEQDKETGYLVATNPRGNVPFGVESKKKYLQLLEQEGSMAKVCDMLGISTRTLQDHVALDEAFRRDYMVTIKRMESVLEGTMYKNALRPNGTMDRFGWLRAHNPNKWNPKTSISVTNTDSATVDKLFSDIDPSKIIDIQAE